MNTKIQCETTPTRAGIVLCGGRSTRMGAPKATLPFGPELMYQRVVRLLREVVDVVVIVLAPEQKLPGTPEGTLLARDRHQSRGPLEGLAAGLAALPLSVEAAYATSCDVPLLVPAFVERMFDQLESHAIAVPRDEQFHHPLSAVYRPSVLQSVELLLAEDRLRPAFLFEEVDTIEVPVDSLRDVDPELTTLENLNRPRDYVLALRRAGLKLDPVVLEAFGDA